MNTEFFKRSSKTVNAVINGTQKTKLALCLKDGRYAQFFWFFVMFSCGGWREFDIRWVRPDLDGVGQIKWMKEVMGARDGGLSVVAESIRDIDLEGIILRMDQQLGDNNVRANG